MKTINLVKIFQGFAVLALAFCLCGCPGHEDPLPVKSVQEGIAVKSVQFYFTNVSDGRLQCVYEYCDNDGSCYTPAEKVDTFRLMSDHFYVCSLELNGEDPKEFFTGTGEFPREYFFSYIPDDVLELLIDGPDMEEDENHSDLNSNWTTGKPGNGTVNFKINHCPDNLVEGLCYEISLPVIIESSEDLN
ncbi:MAG: hypothetical protein RQ743_10965 [Bacteroidales bacterium]|nr:hypothetical protein [Bacteroidales bacterium]